MNFLRKLWNEDEGQDLVEYALIAGLIAVVCVGAITLAGGSVSTIWTAVSTSLQGAAAAV